MHNILHPHQLIRYVCRPPIVWAYNNTLNGLWQPITTSKMVSQWTFNPSLNKTSVLLATGMAYFNVHTTQVRLSSTLNSL